MVDKVFEFPMGRAESLSEAEALSRLLDQIRRDGRVEVESITALGKVWNWTQSRTSKAVTRWGRASHIMRGKIIIRFPEHERHEQGHEQESEGHERHEQGKE